MARPLRCRLSLHAWEYRENPETHEHYQICGRCKAYRDRGAQPSTVEDPGVSAAAEVERPLPHQGCPTTRVGRGPAGTDVELST